MLRVLVCAGTQAAFFQAPPEERKRVFEECKKVFGGWKERFGIDVLGTLDDDQNQIGATSTYPWTFYILCDVPDLDTVNKVVDQLRRGDFPLFKYFKVETRIGRPLSDLGLS